MSNLFEEPICRSVPWPCGQTSPCVRGKTRRRPRPQHCADGNCPLCLRSPVRADCFKCLPFSIHLESGVCCVKKSVLKRISVWIIIHLQGCVTWNGQFSRNGQFFGPFRNGTFYTTDPRTLSGGNIGKSCELIWIEISEKFYSFNPSLRMLPSSSTFCSGSSKPVKAESSLMTSRRSRTMSSYQIILKFSWERFAHAVCRKWV